MKKDILLVVFVACSLLPFSAAFSQTVEVELQDWNTFRQLSVPRQEKLYLHFDKPYYAAGERMWFRAYLLDASSLYTDTLNNAIYVELINGRDSLIYRQKLNKIEGVFSGSFFLHETLPEGTYRIRAYTNWMRNAGDAFFYQRPFFIGNNLSSEIRTTVKYSFLSPKMAMAEIKFAQKDKPLKITKINYKLSTFQGKKSKSSSIETTVDGLFRFEYNPLKFKGKKPFLTVFYEDTINKYERTFILPIKNDFDVQIFPEGGKIIHGATNCIAFKAIKMDGLSVDVEGTLYDEEDKKVIDFKSEHLGMGKFCFLTEIFKRYHIIFKTATGETKRIDLPKGEKETFALGAVVKYGRILVYVKSELNRMVKDSLTLIGHMGGTVFYNEPISGFTPAVVFNTKDMHPGIAHFVLLDKDGIPISELLAFVRPKHPTAIAVDFSKAVHDKREKVYCVIQAKDSKGEPIVDGSFSVAVTDANAVQLDAGNDNIMSNLLLTSDLKGYIENPGSYFDPANRNAEEDIDLLLMTQGWRRFNFEAALKKEIAPTPHPLEKGFTLVGTVQTAAKNKALSNVQVLVYSPSIQYFNEAITTNDGAFSFDSILFPDKAHFTIEARLKKPVKDKLSIQVLEQVFPDIDNSIFPINAPTLITEEYMAVTNEKYFNENGTRNIYAKRRGLISITAEKIVEETKNEQFLFSQEEFVLEGLSLSKRNAKDLPTLIKTLPGLENWKENTQAKPTAEINAHQQVISGPRFAIDGIIYSYHEIKNIKMEELESVRVLKKNLDAENADDLHNTLIALAFKKNNPVSSSADKQNIATVMPLGYADNVLFYEPKYEFFSERTNPIPDWRSTITFIPEVKTGSNGKAIFSFYTADRLSPYNIVVEGISPKGEPCRVVEKRMILYKDQKHLIEK